MTILRSKEPVSWKRVLLRTFLITLAIYLVRASGMPGQVEFPLYWINVLFITLAGFGWLLWRFYKRKTFPSTPLDLPILAWTLVLLVSSLASLDPRRSMETFIYYLVFVLLFYFMVDLERTNKSLESWLSYILVGGVLSIFFGYLQLGLWYADWLRIGGFEQPFPPAIIRVGSPMTHANLLAAYLNLLWPLAIGRLLTTPSRLMKTFLVVWCAAALGLLYFTSSRGGWLGAAAALGMLVLLLALDRREAWPRLIEWLKARRLFIFGILASALILAGLAGMLLLRQIQHPTHAAGDPRGPIWSVAWEMFRQQPLLGTGPATYPLAFHQTYSLPPGMPLVNAHNFLINLLGESGLLGAGTVLWLGVTVLWVTIRRWRAGTPGNRTLLAGSLAALTGLAVHSQFDMPQVVPVVNIITATLLAQLVAGMEVQGRLRRVLGSTLLVAGWLIAAAFGLYSLWGYSALQHGVTAAQDGDLNASATWLDEAVRRDPSVAFYHFQSGQAHAHVAMDENLQVRSLQELENAIDEFERGLEIDETSSLDWTSLGLLRWASGDQPGGIAALEQAVTLAPSSADLIVLLGLKYEDAGQTEPAREQYLRALSLVPNFAKIPLFHESATRREALALFSPLETDVGWRALEAGDYALAEEFYRSQLGLNNGYAYMGLGLALLGQGEFSAAEQALLSAEFIDQRTYGVMETLAKLSESPSERELAVSTIKTAYEMSSVYAIPYDDYYLYSHNRILGLDWEINGIFPWRGKPVISPGG